MTQTYERIIPRRQPIAIVRLDDLTEAVDLSGALLNGGIKLQEFTLTNTEALTAITKVRQVWGEAVTVGAGTVLDAENAKRSIQAGAQFLVTPAFVPDVIEVGRAHNIPVVCGAFTPTEILMAWRAGATYVKVFPAGQLGPGYIKDVLAPLPDLVLVPTGGVNLQNCAAFLVAGAYTVAIGSQLVDKKLVQQGNWEALTRLARQYVDACNGARL